MVQLCLMVELYHFIISFYEEALTIFVEMKNGNYRPISCHYIIFWQEAKKILFTDYKLGCEKIQLFKIRDGECVMSNHTGTVRVRFNCLISPLARKLGKNDCFFIFYFNNKTMEKNSLQSPFSSGFEKLIYNCIISFLCVALFKFHFVFCILTEGTN